MAKRKFTGDKQDDDDLFLQETDGQGSKKAESLGFAELLAVSQQKTFAKLSVGDKVEAKVISKGRDTVFFDIGRRSEGSVDNGEFSPEELQDLKAGDVLTLYVAKSSGEILLSKALRSNQLDLNSIRQAMETGLPVEGKVNEENKGGFVVDIPGGKGFVPFSQIDYGQKQDPKSYLGQTLKFKVMRIQGRDVVLSRAAILREEMAGQREKLLSEMKPEELRDGKITSIETFGIFVDLGAGVNGLVPMSEISWSRRENPRDRFSVGQVVRVKVLKIDTLGEKPRISLSLKQVEGTPWETHTEKIKEGEIVSGYVTKLMPFGAFVEIMPGLEGLIHLSEMSSKRRIHVPGEIVKQGDQVTVKIINIDSLHQKISLSLKALEEEGVVKEANLLSKKLEASRKETLEEEKAEYISPSPKSTFGEAFLSAKIVKKKNPKDRP